MCNNKKQAVFFGHIMRREVLKNTVVMEKSAVEELEVDRNYAGKSKMVLGRNIDTIELER